MIEIDPGSFDRGFGQRPFGFSHDLQTNDLFAFDSLRDLALAYSDDDSFVASSAATPGTPFYDVRHGGASPAEAIDRLQIEPHRVLLKRPENYDSRFRRLLDDSFARFARLHSGLARERVVRLESAIFLSSAAAITPFHFDPEMTFFFQIAGRKRYHVFTPSTLSEPELERFYVKGIVNIGQVDLAGRDPAAEHLFELEPGLGMYQPQNAPHWVETADALSISYTFSFETEAMRAVNRTRSFNHYERQIGFLPASPGRYSRLDAMKSASMRVAIPARKAAARLARLMRAR